MIITVVRFFFMLIWTVLFILISPFLILITFNRQAPLTAVRKLYAPVFMVFAGIKMYVQGKGNVKKDEPVIVVANHCSHIDIPCLVYSIPLNLHFIAKKELKRVPFLGWYIMLTGQLFVDRSNRKKSIESLKKAAKKINHGKTVILFPEGTRSETGEVGVFKKGAFHLALDAQVNVLPVHIEGTRSYWPKGSNKITPGTVTVTIGKPIITANYTKETVNEFIDDTRKAIVAMQH